MIHMKAEFFITDIFNISFRFQPNVCDGYHDFLQKSISFKEVAIVPVKINIYRSHYWSMSKNKAVNMIIKVILSKERNNSQ